VFYDRWGYSPESAFPCGFVLQEKIKGCRRGLEAERSGEASRRSRRVAAPRPAGDRFNVEVMTVEMDKHRSGGKRVFAFTWK
jgi:hypothetical protein